MAILANAYENAIYACMEVKKFPDERECFIHLTLKKKNEKPKTEFTGGVGVSSIIRTAEKYGGYYDFKNDNGVFVFRLLMNIEPETRG